MKRIAIVARLKPGAFERASELVAKGPPFDLDEDGFERHTVYLSKNEVVFVFEGRDVEWVIDDLVSDFHHRQLRESLAAWRPLVEGMPRVAREAYFWERAAPSGAESGGTPGL